MTQALMTQTEARTEAKRINDANLAPAGTVAVASRYPANSWSGQEKGWVVIYRAIS